MSEIPFVKQLGDAIETAIGAPKRARRPRRGRRRFLAVALAALAVAGGSAGVASMLSDEAELGFGSIACFSGPEPTGSVAVVQNVNRTPVEVCADALPSSGLRPSELMACHWKGRGIAVVSRDGRASCAASGLAPVSGDYGRARVRVARLQRAVIAAERRAGCLPPRRFAQRVQAVLDEAGWTGWRAAVRGGEGPCGRVSGLGGSDVRSIAPQVNAARRTVSVMGGAPLALERMLYGSDALVVRLIVSSGERCFELEELKEHARRMLARAERPIGFQLASMPRNHGIERPRGDFYDQGCAIVVGAHPVYPEPGSLAVEVEIWQRGFPHAPG